MNPKPAAAGMAFHLISRQVGAADVGVAYGLDLEHPVQLRELVELRVLRRTQGAESQPLSIGMLHAHSCQVRLGTM